MKEPSNASAVVADFAGLKQSAAKVAAAVAAMRQRVAAIDEEIAVRYAELEQLARQLVPPDELGTFFAAHVDVMAEDGKREVLRVLNGVIHLTETGDVPMNESPFPPMNFADLEGWMNKGKTQRAAGWLRALPLLPLNQRGSVGPNVLAFLFGDAIKAALCDAIREQPIQYQNAKKLTIGTGFEQRRKRVAVLHDEISSLAAERDEVARDIAELVAHGHEHDEHH